MHEGERRGRGKGVAARVGAAEIAAMGKGSAQEGRPPAHRNGFSSRSGVPHGLFSVKSTSCSSLQNAHASGSLRSPYGYLRTATSLWNVPVLRMAYLNKRATCTLLFKTHMLQVRCAHPTPSHRNAPSGHSGVPVGLFYAKSTQYSLLQNARPSGSLRSPCGGLRTVTPLRDIPVFRSAYFTQRVHSTLCSKTLDLQVRCAHPTGTGEPKIPPPPFTAGAGTSEKEMRRKTEGRSAEKLLK